MRLRRRFVVIIGITTFLLVVCCTGSAAAFFLGGLGSKPPANNSSSLACGGTTVDVSAKLPSINSLGAEQIRNAAIIISVGQQMNVPPRGWVIAIATALQESALNNLPDLGANNDHDSLGLFQQRPSQGWGTPQQVMDPVYASRKFYEKLLQIKGWANLPLTVAAQEVQRSAYPDAYAKHEPLATQIVNTLANGAGRSVGNLTTARCAQPGEIAASGWTVPVKGPITSGFRTPSRPTHNGVDIGGNPGTPIHAASAGIVTVVQCQATTASGTFYGCDQNGGLNIQGCGWYVEIRHADNVITRYCHMLHHPQVSVGQQVAAGDVIGMLGDSGNSSGPHCHFEVHLNGDNSAAGAVDPIPFMNQRGAPLGTSA